MVMQGETVFRGASDICSVCGFKLKIGVMKSNAGYYIGYSCINEYCSEVGLPYSRESYNYYPTSEAASRELITNKWKRR